MGVEHLHSPNAPAQWPSMGMTRRVQHALFAKLLDVHGLSERRADRQDRLDWASNVLGWEVESFRDLDDDDAGVLLQRLRDDERSLEEPWQ